MQQRPASARAWKPATGFLLLGLTLAPGCSERAPTTDAAFTSAVQDYVQDACRRKPVWASEIGVHDFDAELDDMSPAAARPANEWLRRFEAFDPGKLSRDNRIDREILIQHLEGEMYGWAQLREWQTNPLLYTRLAGNSIHLLLARDYAPLEVRLESARQRLLQMPRLLRQAERNLQHPPRVHTEVALRQNRGLVQLIREDVAGAAAGTRLQAAVEQAADSAVAALDHYERFLQEDLLPRSDGDFRLGRRRFDRKLRYTLQSDLGSDEIRQRAEAEVSRVRRRMFALVLPLAGDAVSDSVRAGQDEEARIDAAVRPVLARIAADHPRPSELLQACSDAVDSLRRFVVQRGVVRLDPSQQLAVAWTPEVARGVNVAGLDAPGPLERRLPSFYHVQPIPADWTPEQAESYLREYNRAMIQVLSMHEAMPGHFVQLCHSNRCPSLARSVFPNAAFVEGWAVYAERLMLESGYGAGDPRLALQQLKFYLRSVLNVLVDIGVHCDGMSESEAVHLLVTKGFQEESEARAKWLRVQLSSTQLCTYFAGLQEILALEAADRARRGAAWSRRDFVERLLAHGSPPVHDLRELLLEPAPGANAAGIEAAP